MLNLEPNGQLPEKTGICDEDFHRPVNSQERGQINFPNYALQLQAIFVRYKSTKTLKQLTIPAIFALLDRTNLT